MDPTTNCTINDLKDAKDLNADEIVLRDFKMALDQDLKESIPYYDNNANNTNQLSSLLAEELNKKDKYENPDEMISPPTMWKTEDESSYLDDENGYGANKTTQSGNNEHLSFYPNSETITGIRSDSGGGSALSDTSSMCAENFNATSPASVCFSDDSIPEMKYIPNESPMQPPLPPSSSASTSAGFVQYPSHRQQTSHHLHSHLQPPISHASPHNFGIPVQRYPAMLSERLTPQYPYPPAIHHQGPQQSYNGQPPPNFYPNMWYPNAPYGSSSNYYHPYSHRGYGSHPNPAVFPGYPHDPMMEMLQLSNSGREARNRAEKNRRDKLNGSIQTLSTIVPHVAESPRRVDKTAVLRFAAHGLRILHVFGKSRNLENPELTDRLMMLLDSFFLTLTCNGQIVLISNSIEQHLGHCQTDLYGQNILQITHPDDHGIVKQQLIPTDLENLFDVQSDDESGEPRPRTQAEEDYIDKKLLEDKRSFTIRLARAGPRSEPTSYEIVKIDGCFRRSDCAPRGVKTSTYVSSLQLIRRTRGREDSIPLHTVNGNDIVLVAIARVIKPPKTIPRNLDSNLMEYKTRHLIDGRIIDCDQRIGIVAGYMRDEVRNLSPFTFIHQDDVRWVIVALRQMYDCNSSFGESTYRLYTRNRNFIYLHTKGYLEIDQSNKVHSFVCVNTLLDEDEGKRRVQDMKRKFSVIINGSIPQSSIDAPAAENPHQLEKAVLCLIQNLQKNSSDEDEPGSSCHQSNNMFRLSASSQRGSSKTPPLALVPPEPSSIKTSISQSLKIVNVHPSKKFVKYKPNEGEDIIDAADDDHDDDPIDDFLDSQCKSKNDDEHSHCHSESINEGKLLKRLSKTGHDEPERKRLRSTEIENVLTTSLDQICRSLNRQRDAVNELRDCSNKFLIPNTNERIEEIMEEHQEQSEIFLNIKSEYEVQRQNNKLNTAKAEADSKHNSQELRPS